MKLKTMYRGFSRFWLVLSFLLGAFAWYINDAKGAVLTFIIVMAIGHGVFWVILGLPGAFANEPVEGRALFVGAISESRHQNHWD